MKISCPTCSAKYSVADEKIQSRLAKIRCRKCSSTIVIDGTASPAKVYVGDRVPELVQDCVQIHGGIGLTWEHDIHLYLRRVTLGRALYGTPDDHRERLAVATGL